MYTYIRFAAQQQHINSINSFNEYTGFTQWQKQLQTADHIKRQYNTTSVTNGGETDPEHAEQNERCKFNEIPRVVVLNIEHHQMVVAKRVKRS